MGEWYSGALDENMGIELVEMPKNSLKGSYGEGCLCFDSQ